ncbi:MAG TPA: DUF4129 domain-containing protein [Candidatus Thermoplasmatota archaeon]|jgi:hypothetical protein|nr:DUF4129 domain-containing protein [Candidatus Thermoplasmatota archaeon]
MDLPAPSGGWSRAVLVVAVAFSAGAQLVFVLQGLAVGDYFQGDLAFKFGTLAVLAVGGYLLWKTQPHPTNDAPPAAPPAAPAAAPAPPAPRPSPAPAQIARPAGSRAPAIQIVVETPLARGPVWPPGEPLPITLQVRGASQADLASIDVELELRHAGGAERARVAMREPTAVLSQTVPSPGPFQVKARALWQGAVVAEATVDGRAASYREEIGRRFDALKANAEAAGLPVGADSTPREVREVLARRYPTLRRSLDDMVGALEVALFAEDEVGRETYEALARALAEVEQRGLEAVPRG